VVAVYAGAIVLGILLRVLSPSTTSVVYQTYRDLMPLVIALPAAFLAQAFQRRASYVQGLRSVWSNMVNAFAAALTYTELPDPSKELYADVLRRLSASIEEVRGFYANIPAASPSTGWFPFESLVKIHGAILGLGFGETATRECRDEVHEEIFLLWKRLRTQFLDELDVEVPTGRGSRTRVEASRD
jgi:hypothetical protein